MATTRLAPDFKEFLRLLPSATIEHLLVDGHAVGDYSVRAMGDDRERRFPNRLCFFPGAGGLETAPPCENPRWQNPTLVARFRFMDGVNGF